MQSVSIEPASIEKVSIWILEELEKEWRREPDPMKCRPASEVLAPLKGSHGLTDDEITRALKFMLAESRRYLTVLNRPDGKAILPSDNGLAVLARIAEGRSAEQERKKWSRSDRIALASLFLSVVSFLAGFHFGERSAKDSWKTQTPLQSTNAVQSASPKTP